MFDGKAFGQEVVAAVNDFLNKNLMPVVERLDVLEKRFADFPTPKDGEPGKDADAEAVAEIVARDVTARVEQVRTDLAGFRDDMEQTIETEVAKHFAKLPKVPTLDEVIEAIPAPQDGKSITAEELAPLIEDRVQRAVSALPVPKDGEPGRNGFDAVEFLRGDDGHLIVTMSNGTTRDLGQFIGKDGEPGKDGNPGRDGFGFDDLDVVETEKGWMIRFKRAEDVKEFRLPIPVDRGVFKDGQSYVRGDGVSFGGSWFIAQEDTTDKPETSKAWRLAVKRGRDAKPVEVKPAPDPKPVKVG